MEKISYIFGTHDPKLAKSFKEMGACAICDQPIYGQGVVKAFRGDTNQEVPIADAVEESKKHSYFKYMSIGCLFTLADKVHDSYHVALGEDPHNVRSS